MIFKIYCLKDELGNMKYIGYTSLSEARRMAEHRHSHSQRKNYKFEVLDVFDTKAEALEAERAYIEQYREIYELENIANGQGYPEAFDGRRGITNRKKVYCFETEQVYDSCSEAAEKLNISKSQHIARVARGERNSCHGYHFKFAS